MLGMEEWIGSRLDSHENSVLALGCLKFWAKPELCNLNQFSRGDANIMSALGTIRKENIDTQFMEAYSSLLLFMLS